MSYIPPEKQIPNNFRILLDVAKMVGWSSRDLLDTANYICDNSDRLSALSPVEYHYLLNERSWPDTATRPTYIEL
jgi:hypothetical protein